MLLRERSKQTNMPCKELVISDLWYFIYFEKTETHSQLANQKCGWREVAQSWGPSALTVRALQSSFLTPKPGPGQQSGLIQGSVEVAQSCLQPSFASQNCMALQLHYVVQGLSQEQSCHSTWTTSGLSARFLSLHSKQPWKEQHQ